MRGFPFDDDDLRAAFQTRAAGTPRPDLHGRIRAARRATHQTARGRFVAEAGGRLPLFARFMAVATIAVLVLLAPLARTGPGEASERDSSAVASLTQESIPAAPAVGPIEADHDEDEIHDTDDVGDDEDDVSQRSIEDR